MTRADASWTFTRAHVLVLLAYLTAAAAAVATILFYEAHPLLEVLLAGVVATVIIFQFSLLFRNSSFYDPYWSIAPVLIALYFLSLPDQAVTARQILVSALLLSWAVRLTGNWAYGWQGIRHEDWRYEKLDRTAGRLWRPLSSVGAHRFRVSRAGRSGVLDTSSWAICRHPNDLGEIGFRVSLFAFGVAAWGWVYPFSWLGPVVMMGLFLVVSIPMIERKLDAGKPGYAAYRQRTPMLLPRGRRRRSS